MSRDESHDPVSLGQGTCQKETARAVLVSLDREKGEAFWIPKSVLDDDSEVYSEGDVGEVHVQQWWARKEGLDR